MDTKVFVKKWFGPVLFKIFQMRWVQNIYSHTTLEHTIVMSRKETGNDDDFESSDWEDNGSSEEYIVNSEEVYDFYDTEESYDSTTDFADAYESDVTRSRSLEESREGSYIHEDTYETQDAAARKKATEKVKQYVSSSKLSVEEQQALNAKLDQIEKSGLTKISTSAQCTLLAIGGMVQGSIAGFIFGTFNHAFMGLVSGRHKYPGFGKEIMANSRMSAGMFALWLGTYFGSQCVVKSIRKQERADILTVGLSGYMAGAVSVLKTRNPRAIMVNGLTSATLVMVVQMFSSTPPL